MVNFGHITAYITNIIIDTIFTAYAVSQIVFLQYSIWEYYDKVSTTKRTRKLTSTLLNSTASTATNLSTNSEINFK